MKQFNNKGFTLIEIVIGMTVLAIAMMLMNAVLITQSRDTLTPLHQLRATQLGQSILQNVLSRSYGENAVELNGGEAKAGQNTDDVNDFITDGFISIASYKGILRDNFSPQYNDYQMKITVRQDTRVIDNAVMKHIEVTIKMPNDDEISFSALKGNY